MEAIGNVIFSLVTMLKPYSIPLLIFCLVIGGIRMFFGASRKRFALSMLIGSVIGFILVNTAENIAQTIQNAINF